MNVVAVVVVDVVVIVHIAVVTAPVVVGIVFDMFSACVGVL